MIHPKPSDFMRAISRGHLPGTPGFLHEAARLATEREKSLHRGRVHSLTVACGYTQAEVFERVSAIPDPMVAHDMRHFVPDVARVERWVRGTAPVRFVVQRHPDVAPLVLDLHGTRLQRLL